MKNFIKRIFNIFLAFTILLNGIINHALSISAASGNLVITYPDGYSTGRMIYASGGGVVCEDGKDHRLFTLGGEERFLGIFSLNGENVYCIQPFVSTSSGYYYTSSTISASGLSESVKNRLELASYFGYGYNDDNSMLTRIATQMAIWEFQGAKVEQITTALRDKINIIKQRVIDYENKKKPSFDNQTITLLGYGKEYAITIKDTNNVVSQWFKGNVSEGLHYTLNENTISVWADKPFTGSKTIEFDLINKNDSRIKGDSIVYINSKNAQKLAKFSDPVIRTTEVNFKMATGSLNLIKQDTNGNLIPNTTFNISYNEDMSNPIGSFTTGNNGNVQINDLLPQELYIQEISVPSPLLLDGTIKKVSIIGNETISYTATNKIQLGQIAIEKIDKETGSMPQGEATLHGATYDVYDSTKTKIVDELIYGSKNTTNLLPLSTYYLKERIAPTGYTLNEEWIKIVIPYTNATENVSLIKTQVEDKVIAGKIFIKKSVDSLFYDKVAKNNFLFSKNKSILISGVGFEFDIIQDSTGSIVDTLTTDETGCAISNELPYGHYTIQERETEAYTTIDPIHVFIKEDGKTYYYNVLNEIKKSALTIVKKDADTKNTIPVNGVGFKLRKEDGTYLTQTVSKIDTFYTNDDGKVILPEKLNYGETYKIEEVSGTAPNKYLLLLEGKTFTVNGDENITIEILNQPVKGSIKINKSGELLSDIKIDSNGNIVFVYDNLPLADISFKISAAEDIKAEDLVSEDYYKKDEVIAIINTNNDGIAILDNLPLGKYKIEEISTPDGMIKNTEVKFVELKYENETTEIVFESVDIINNRQKVKVDILKQDKESNLPLPNAVFGLYTLDDIYSYDHSTLLVNKGTLIETSYTNKDGIAHFLSDLPLNIHYEIREITPPKGYLVTEDTYSFYTEYKDSTKETIVFSETFENEPTVMKFSKVDFATEKELAGATITITDKETGIVIDKWTSTNEPHIIKCLVEGKEYIMSEEIAPSGYDKAESITFIAKHGEKIVMKDKLLPEKPKVPNTSDESNVLKYVLLASLSGLSIISLFILKKKIIRNNEEE